ncbi:MAG: outer membrane beta-barrel protein [Rhodospirillales bacterium]|nr:outer membrane beta-barrel protein [Rhodospirillales bacterium]
MTTKHVWPACAITTLALSVSSAAWAQQLGPLVRTGPEATAVRGETVATRARPELDPLGVRLGTFLVYPSIGLQGTWNDNVFAVNSTKDAKSDFVADITPGVAVESDWANHALNFRSVSMLAVTPSTRGWTTWTTSSPRTVGLT